MNATHSPVPLAPHMPVAGRPGVESAPLSSPAPRRYRDRDFGVGYGASSGYAPGKRYTSDWGQARFRFR